MGKKVKKEKKIAFFKDNFKIWGGDDQSGRCTVNYNYWMSNFSFQLKLTIENFTNTSKRALEFVGQTKKNEEVGCM